MTSPPEARPARRAGSFARIVKLARPEARNLAVGTFFLAVASVTSLLFPQAIRRIVDDALAANQTDTTRIDQAALFLVVVFAIQAISTSLRYALFTTSGERVVAR